MAHNHKYDPARHGPINTVWMAHMSGRTLWAFCAGCGHVKSVDTWHLAKSTKTGDLTLDQAAKRFRCTRCLGGHTMLIPAAGLGHG